MSRYNRQNTHRNVQPMSTQRARMDDGASRYVETERMWRHADSKLKLFPAWKHFDDAVVAARKQKTLLDQKQQMLAEGVQKRREVVQQLVTFNGELQQQIDALNVRIKTNNDQISREQCIIDNASREVEQDKSRLEFLQRVANRATNGFKRCKFGVNCHNVDPKTDVSVCPFFHSPDEHNFISKKYQLIRYNREQERLQAEQERLLLEEQQRQKIIAEEQARAVEAVERIIQQQLAIEKANDDRQSLRRDSVTRLISESTDLIPALVKVVMQCIEFRPCREFSKDRLTNGPWVVPLFKCQFKCNKSGPTCDGITTFPMVDRSDKTIKIHCARCSRTIITAKTANGTDVDPYLKLWWRHGLIQVNVPSAIDPEFIVAKGYYTTSAAFVHYDCACEWKLLTNPLFPDDSKDSEGSLALPVLYYEQKGDRVNNTISNSNDEIVIYRDALNTRLCDDKTCFSRQEDARPQQSKYDEMVVGDSIYSVTDPDCDYPETGNILGCICKSLRSCICGQLKIDSDQMLE